MENTLAEKVDSYIRTHYKNKIKEMNKLLCLFKTNIDKIENIKNIEDFEIKYNQSKGSEEELLYIINKCKNNQDIVS